MIILTILFSTLETVYGTVRYVVSHQIYIMILNSWVKISFYIFVQIA